MFIHLLIIQSMKLLIKIVLYLIAIVITTYLLEGVRVANNESLVLLSIALLIIRGVIRPVLKVLTFPITLLTLGLFMFVLNGLLILLAAEIVPGFEVDNFWWALLFSLILSFFMSILETISKLVIKDKKK